MAVNLRWVGRIVALGALTGIVSSVLTSVLGQSRVLIVLGRAKLLPEWLVRIFLEPSLVIMGSVL